MNLSDMQTAVADAKSILARADLVATELARLLAGRLRHVESAWLLADLKKELRAFNIQTKEWNTEA